MSTNMGIVLVYEKGVRWDDVVHAFRSYVADESKKGIAGKHSVEIQEYSDGLLTMEFDAMGFNMARFTWNPNYFCADEELAEKRIIETVNLIETVIADPPPLFGYMTHYADRIETRFIENEVLSNLLSDEYERIDPMLFDWVLYPLYAKVSDKAEGAKVDVFEKYALYYLSETLNPFAN